MAIKQVRIEKQRFAIDSVLNLDLLGGLRWG